MEQCETTRVAPCRPLTLGSLIELTSLPGVQEITSTASTLYLTYPEAEIVIRFSNSFQSRWDTDWQVTVREPGRGLGTWWGTWRHSFLAEESDIGPLVTNEIQETLLRIRRMLDDYTRFDLCGDPSAPSNYPD